MAAVSPVGRAAGLEPLELRAGDQAGDGLYERHATRVFAYCRSKLGRREDAEDAVQTTFLHAVRGLRRGVVPSVELAWLLGIARNVCLSKFESAGRRGRLELVCDPVDLERSAAPQGRRDELIGLEEALAQLPEQQRHAVLLRDWRGLSYEEVASRLGVSLANAETLIFRGRRTLAELLQEQPSTVRRRLAALGNLGSLASAIKTAFVGAAAATKIAAAITVVAVAGTGVAAGTGVLAPAMRAPRREAPTARAGGPAASVVPDPRTVAPITPAKATIAVASQPASQPKNLPAKPSAGERQTATPITSPTAVPAADPSTGPTAAPPASTPAAPRSAAPVPVAKVPIVEDTVVATGETVQSTVDQIVPELPIATPVLPEAIGSLPVPELPPVETVVETVVAAVPPVTVTLPVIEPITIDPPKLLP